MYRGFSEFVISFYCLEQWWSDRKESHCHIRELVINLDNGPELNSHRTQFMKRLVEFSDQNNLRIRLVDSPPYHSKFNLIERCWGILEEHWNGTLLTSVKIIARVNRSVINDHHVYFVIVSLS